MKTLFFFTDTETTGLLQEKDQILSYAMVFVEKEKSLLEKEIKIRIKDNIFPNPTALIVNNLNPFSSNFIKESISEYEAAHLLAKTLLDYKHQGYRIVLIAYNANFDVQMYTSMFKRCGINFNALVNFVYDPLITAKSLVQEGTLITREIKVGYGGKTYKSSKLEDVYNSLGYSSESIIAHNALEDTKMLKTVCMKLYLLFSGKTMDEAEINLSDFNEKDVKSIVYSENMDLKIKTIKIIKKATEFGENGFFALDYDLITKNTESIKLNIIFIDPSFIFDEVDLKASQVIKLDNYYFQNEKAINDLVSEMSFPQIKIHATHEELYFERIAKIAELKIKNINYSLTEEESPFESLAEAYSYARYNDGWSVKIKGVNYLNDPKQMKIDSEYLVELNPTGVFYVRKNGEVSFGSEKKTEILQNLVAEGKLQAGTDLYKKISAFLIAVKIFKNQKHPSFLIKEFNDKKTEIFSGANKLHKDILKGLLDHYKKMNKEEFKELMIPEFKLNLNVFKKS